MKAVKQGRKAQRYLSQLLFIDDEIEQDLLEIERLEQTAAGIQAVRYDRDKVQTSPTDHLAEAVAKIADYQEKLTADRIAMIELRDKIKSQLLGITNPVYRAILARRYMYRKTFEDIATDLTYSYAHVRKLHTDALVVFERLYL